MQNRAKLLADPILRMLVELPLSVWAVRIAAREVRD